MKVKTTTKRPKSPGDQIFSHPVRRLSADELKKAAGDMFFSPQRHGKCSGGMDNQGREF